MLVWMTQTYTPKYRMPFSNSNRFPQISFASNQNSCYFICISWQSCLDVPLRCKTFECHCLMRFWKDWALLLLKSPKTSGKLTWKASEELGPSGNRWSTSSQVAALILREIRLASSKEWSSIHPLANTNSEWSIVQTRTCAPEKKFLV